MLGAANKKPHAKNWTTLVGIFWIIKTNAAAYTVPIKLSVQKKNTSVGNFFFKKKCHFSWNLSCKIRLYRSGSLYFWFLASKITFFQIWIFSDLGDFLSKTKKIGCLSLSLLTILLVKKLHFLRYFYLHQFYNSLITRLDFTDLKNKVWLMIYEL